MNAACTNCGGSQLEDVSGFGHLEACSECAGSVNSTPTLNPTALYEHKKRGSLYRIIGTGMMQASGNEIDGVTVVIYQGVSDGQLFSRPMEQFLDGRFTEVQRQVEISAAALLRQVRESLQFANENPGSGINDTLWMMHGGSTVFDELDGAIELVARLECQGVALKNEAERLGALLNTPELSSFRDAVVREAAHQRERHGSAHDANKTSADWFWLVAHLATKAMCSIKEAEHTAMLIQGEGGNARIVLEQQLRHYRDKSLHHVITTAAALANWHAALVAADRAQSQTTQG